MRNLALNSKIDKSINLYIVLFFFRGEHTTFVMAVIIAVLVILVILVISLLIFIRINWKKNNNSIKPRCEKIGKFLFVWTAPPPPINLIILCEYFLTLTWVCIFELSYSIISNTSYQCTIICKQKKKHRNTLNCVVECFDLFYMIRVVFFCSRECRWVGWINYRKQGWF